MRFISEFRLGISSYFQAIKFVKVNRLWHLLIIPSLLNLFAFALVGYVSWVYTGEIIAYLTDKIGLDASNQVLVVVQFVMAFIIRMIVLLLYFKIYRYIILIFFAPMLAFISDKVQEIDTGIAKPFTVVQFTKDIYRGMTVAIRNLFLELLITAALLLLVLVIPIFAVVVPWIIFTIESYFYGFAMMDYRNEFKLLNARESRALINNHRGLAIGTGTMFNLMLFIPVLGALVAPVLAVVAGGLALNQVDKPK